jgi:hypothetical protein
MTEANQVSQNQDSDTSEPERIVGGTRQELRKKIDKLVGWGFSMPRYEVALGPHEFYLTDDIHINIEKSTLSNGVFYQPQVSVNGKWRTISDNYKSFYKTAAEAKQVAYKFIKRTTQ